MKNKLSLINVSKKLGNKQVYKNFSLSLENGCHAITGENGVGKTVLLELIAGVSAIDNGEIYLDNTGDCNSIEYKKRLAYVPSVSLFYPTAKGTDILNFVLSIKNTPSHKNPESELNKFIQDSGLYKYMDMEFKKMSLGTQKKIFLSTMFIGNNSLLILDEPDNGLDDSTIDLLVNNITSMSKKMIIIIVSHDQKFLDKIKPTVIPLKQTKSGEVIFTI